MKHRPSVGSDITKKDPEKPPQGFEDVNLSKPVVSGPLEQIPQATYEDAMTNLGFEDTEMQEELENDLDLEKQKNDLNGEIVFKKNNVNC